MRMDRIAATSATTIQMSSLSIRPCGSEFEGSRSVGIARWPRDPSPDAHDARRDVGRPLAGSVEVRVDVPVELLVVRPVLLDGHSGGGRRELWRAISGDRRPRDLGVAVTRHLAASPGGRRPFGPVRGIPGEQAQASEKTAAEFFSCRLGLESQALDRHAPHLQERPDHGRPRHDRGDCDRPDQAGVLGVENEGPPIVDRRRDSTVRQRNPLVLDEYGQQVGRVDDGQEHVSDTPAPGNGKQQGPKAEEGEQIALVDAGGNHEEGDGHDAQGDQERQRVVAVSGPERGAHQNDYQQRIAEEGRGRGEGLDSEKRCDEHGRDRRNAREAAQLLDPIMGRRPPAQG